MTMICCGQAGAALYGVLLAGELVAALAQPRAHPLAPADLLLLSHFVRGSASFRQGDAQSFTPVCLPTFDASAFLHAHVSYIDQARSSCLEDKALTTLQTHNI